MFKDLAVSERRAFTEQINVTNPEFRALSRPARWDGYFGRAPDHPYAFHIRPHNLRKFWPHADWIMPAAHLEIPFVQAPNQPYDVAPRDLSVAVNDALKRNAPGRFDGTFLINEFGNVLVPSRDSSQILHVGDWHGPIWLEDAYSPAADPIELYGVEGLVIGDAWKRPYVGSSYTTAVVGSRVVVSAREGKGALGIRGYFEGEVLPLLRRVHWDSKMHFLVTHGGLVLTRVVLSSRGKPEPPVFCGTLDLERWKTVVAEL